MTDTKSILVPLHAKDLAILQWFGEWTPEVHRADWDNRKTWPPGFRKIYDGGVYNPEKKAEAERTLSYFSFGKDGTWDGGNTRRRPGKTAGSRCYCLLAYQLLEGSSTCLRLTRRGRAALLYHDLPCPAEFESHCSEIFNPVSLIPLGDDLWDAHDLGTREYQYGVAVPDEKEFWRQMMIEYREGDYQGRHTITKASAQLTRFQGSGMWMNGSLRQHNQGLSLSVNSNDGRQIVDVSISLEQFTDILTAQSNVPVTIAGYTGSDGMYREEPAPPAVNPVRRMKERLAKTESTAKSRLNEALEIVEGRSGKSLSKTNAEKIINLIQMATDQADEDRGFVVQQSMEEVSQIAESVLSIAKERLGLSGLESFSLGGLEAKILPEYEGDPD